MKLFVHCTWLIFFLLLTVTAQTFVNPIAEGRDPWVIKKDSIYYSVTTYWNQSIVVWKSKKLTDRGIKRTVWTPPTNPDAWNRQDIWAPELHYINGRWYIYYTAGKGTEQHPESGITMWPWQRVGVLECYSQDPTAAAWVDRGLLYTGDDIDNWDGRAETNIWAIDATPLEMNGKLYLIWSGWDSTVNLDNNGFTQQNLYIAEMKDPVTVSSNRVKIAWPEYDWEQSHISPQKLLEGPEILKYGHKIFLIYSTPDFWTVEYKMGMLTINDGQDPMNPANWVKSPQPVFSGTDQVYSVGHGSFTVSPDGSEYWLVYRSKQKPEGGWERDVRLHKFAWNADGTPNFGQPEPAGKSLSVPSGEKPNEAGEFFKDEFSIDNTRDAWDNWLFYGWDGNLFVENKMLKLGGGDFQLWAGDKALVRGFDWQNFTLQTDIKILSGNKTAGVVFRVKEPAFGLHAFKGYETALDIGQNKLVLSTFDGTQKSLLKQADFALNYNTWYRLKVEANGPIILVYLNETLQFQVYDTTFPQAGMAGIRTDETYAAYDNFEIKDKNYVSLQENKSKQTVESFVLLNSYPNPFNDSIMIEYSLPRTGTVDFVLYDVTGKRLKFKQWTGQAAGKHQFVLKADNLTSGVYWCVLKFSGQIVRQKIVLIK